MGAAPYLRRGSTESPIVPTLGVWDFGTMRQREVRMPPHRGQRHPIRYDPRMRAVHTSPLYCGLTRWTHIVSERNLLVC